MTRFVQRCGFGVGVLVASASVVASPLQTVSPATGPNTGTITGPVTGLVTGSIRGLWVPRTAMTSADSITAMVQAAASGGFNTLLVQVRGRGEAFYRSDIEPRASDLDRQPLDFDPLATAIALARASGLAVHAWVNVNLVASGTTLPRSRDHVVAQHPDWLMVPRALASTMKKTNVSSPAYLGTLARWTRNAPDLVEGLYLSPVAAAARAYTTSVIAELAARYDLDRIHLDYLRYPGAEFDFSTTALAAFRDAASGAESRSERDRLDRTALTDPAAWADARPAAWATFQRERLTSLVAAIQGAARAARPGLIVSAAVVAAASEARNTRYQDWLAWAKAGQIDVPCPMLYTLSAEQFASTTSEIRVALGAVPFWAGIGAYRLPLDGTIERVRLARRASADGVLLFSYGQLAETGSTASAALAALRTVLLETTNGSSPRR